MLDLLDYLIGTLGEVIGLSLIAPLFVPFLVGRALPAALGSGLIATTWGPALDMYWHGYSAHHAVMLGIGCAVGVVIGVLANAAWQGRKRAH